MNFISATEIHYLCSSIIQSLAALLGITLIAYGYISETGRRIQHELFNLAEIWWTRANLTLQDAQYRPEWRPDVTRHTTVETAHTFLKRNLRQIREKYPEMADAIEEKLSDRERFTKLKTPLFKKGLFFTFLGLILSTIMLVLAPKLNESFVGFIVAILLILLFFVAIGFFIELIMRILGLGTNILAMMIPNWLIRIIRGIFKKPKKHKDDKVQQGEVFE